MLWRWMVVVEVLVKVPVKKEVVVENNDEEEVLKEKEKERNWVSIGLDIGCRRHGNYLRVG